MIKKKLFLGEQIFRIKKMMGLSESKMDKRVLDAILDHILASGNVTEKLDADELEYLKSYGDSPIPERFKHLVHSEKHISADKFFKDSEDGGRGHEQY